MKYEKYTKKRTNQIETSTKSGKIFLIFKRKKLFYLIPRFIYFYKQENLKILAWKMLAQPRKLNL